MKKSLSRVLAMLVVVALLVSQIVALPVVAATTTYCSVCGENGVKAANPEHTIDATCGKAGYTIWACTYVKDGKTCTGTITEPIPATGTHTGGETVPAVPATCTEPGSVAYKVCTGCGKNIDPTTNDVLDTIVVPATGHTYVDVVTPPSCTAGGYTTKTCACGDVQTVDPTDKLEHTYVDQAGLEATCREPGYTAYKQCACGAIDPENPKTEIPVQNHGGHFVESEYVAPSCHTAGKNVFKCEKPDCPYYDGVTEVLPALKHTFKVIAKKNPTCTEDGYAMHKHCTRCDKLFKSNASDTATTSYVLDDFVTAAYKALGHTTVSKGYVAPTCSEPGMTDAIVCDRCDFVHHMGEVIAATGHTLTDVAGVEADCTKDGKIAHKKCTVCEKLFATSATGAPTDTPITNVVITKLGHDYAEWVTDSTCTEVGYKIYTCKRPTGVDTECEHTYSERIEAKGHDFEFHAQVDAECEVAGTKAYNTCKRADCNATAKYAADADPMANPTPVTDASLVIAALEHVPEVVEAVNPTYDAAGCTAGSKCKVCDKLLGTTTELPELQEGVEFYYEISGVNGADKAVNSGYVKLDVYFDVLTAADDDDAYKSDVLANIFAAEIALDYNKDAFVFESFVAGVKADGTHTFKNASFTKPELADGKVKIAQENSTNTGAKAYEVYRGEKNHFATLYFQVKTNATAGNYAFTLSDATAGKDILVVSPYADETIDTQYAASVAIDVLPLGDTNGDGVFNSADLFAVTTWRAEHTGEADYETQYDMDKDGAVTFYDIQLLREAIVGNKTYLEITVNPNVVTPEG